MDKWLPVKKIVAVFLGSAITWVALQLGVDLGSDEINQAATALVGLAFGYLVPE